MNLLVPIFPLRFLPAMLTYAGLGALLAGCYGALHDQVTYSISSEYFTRFKFVQFHYADFNLPRRLFVAEIGFLATWWVGAFVAWFLARVSVPAFPPALARRRILVGCAIVLAFAVGAALVGYLLSYCEKDLAAWEDVRRGLRIKDLPAFVRVAYIHNASYLGGLTGLVVAVVWLRYQVRHDQQLMDAAH
jgi:hypothetical protein